MFTQQFFIEGLGCASYLVGSDEQRVAAVIDPDRDVQKYLDAADEHGVKITHIIETHLHADHVSGNTELAARTGAKIFLHEQANAAFPHETLREGDTVSLGKVCVKILHTPGHTPESITLLITDTSRGDEAALALTGDTLFVGDVGRPDLVGADEARQLAGTMYDSIQHKLLPLADGLIVYPAHGAGSLCGRSLGEMRVSTLGYERHFNPSLAPRTRDEFIAYDITELPEQPGNHVRIKQMNQQGPRILGDIQPRALSIDEAVAQFRSGSALLDTRPRAQYAARHIPGAVHLEATTQLSNRVGMLLSPDEPVVLLLDDAADYHDVFFMLARVGFDQINGYLSESLDAWDARGLPVTSGDIQDIDPRELVNRMANDSRLVVLDVREPWEYKNGHVPGAKLIPLPELFSRVGELDSAQPIAVICESGHRSQTGAALLAQKGFKTLYNVREGTSGWRRRGFPIET